MGRSCESKEAVTTAQSLTYKQGLIISFRPNSSFRGSLPTQELWRAKFARSKPFGVSAQMLHHQRIVSLETNRFTFFRGALSCLYWSL